MAGLDFKSSGICREAGSVGSIPMHLRQLCLHQAILPHPYLGDRPKSPVTGPIVLGSSLYQQNLLRFPWENPAEKGGIAIGTGGSKAPRLSSLIGPNKKYGDESRLHAALANTMPPCFHRGGQENSAGPLPSRERATPPPGAA